MKADNVVVMGRLVVLERGRGMASNYDCDFCCCVLQPSSISVSPSSISSLPGDTGSFTARAQTIDCNGNPRFFNATASCTWSSSNTNVAVLGSLSGSEQLVQAVGPGTAQILADYSFPNLVVQPGPGGCICEPDGTNTDLTDSATCDVRIPYMLNALAPTTETVCSGKSCMLDIKYQVLDVNGAPIQRSGMNVAESSRIAPDSPCTGTWADAGTWTTDGTGTMTTPDYWWWCCTNGTCTMKFTQTFTVSGYPIYVINYNGFAGTHNIVTIQCSSSNVSTCPVIVPTP